MARERLEFDEAGLAGRAYPLLNSSVVPRPIAWVSTRSADGVDNLAPHSFFTVASADPPVVCFTSVGAKDTLANCRATGEFVVAVVTDPLAEAANATSTDFPHGVSEFDAAGLTREPAAVVAPPRVAESPVALECRVVDERTFGEGSTASTVVFGRVVHVALDPAVVVDGLPDMARLRPVSRLNRDLWAGLGTLFGLRRVPVRDWDGTPDRRAPR